MIRDMNLFIKYLNEKEITANQYVMMQLLLSNRHAELSEFSDLMSGSFIENWEKEVKDLEDRGYIQNVNDLHSCSAYVVTDKFMKDEKAGIIQATEFWDTYPAFSIGKKGEYYPLKGVLQSEFFVQYLNEINFSIDQHKKMMEILRYGIDFGKIKVRINIFLGSRQYKDIEREMF